MRIETNGTDLLRDVWEAGVKKELDTYEKLYAILTAEETGLIGWDFRTLNQTRPVLGQAMGEVLVRLEYLDRVEDRFKHYVPTPQELERMVRGD